MARQGAAPNARSKHGGAFTLYMGLPQPRHGRGSTRPGRQVLESQVLGPQPNWGRYMDKQEPAPEPAPPQHTISPSKQALEAVFDDVPELVPRASSSFDMAPVHRDTPVPQNTPVPQIEQLPPRESATSLPALTKSQEARFGDPLAQPTGCVA
jgi:hypothetical protein